MSTDLTLYQIADRYKAAFEALADADLPPEAVDDTLEAIEGEIQEKGRNVAAFFQDLEASAKAMKEAEDRMRARRQAVEKKVARLKEYLRFHMDRCGIKEIACPEFTVRLRQNPARVVIDSEDDLDPEFIRVKTVREIDKKAIAAALKEGREVGAAHLEHGTRIEVK